MMKLSIKTEKVAVMKFEKYITINGVKFEAMDLYDTLMELRPPCNIRIRSRDMIELFKKIKVIESAGSGDIPASIGKNYQSFCKALKPHFDKLLWSKLED